MSLSTAVAPPRPHEADVVGGCVKTAFRTRKDARMAYQKLIRSGKSRDPTLDWQLAEYRCERCGSWHFGHSSSRTLVRLRLVRQGVAS